MSKRLLYALLTTLLVFNLLTTVYGQNNTRTVDICIYGGTSAGVMAAYTARMKGKTVLLIEPRRHLGGMTSGGLGQTDIGNKYAITGLSRDFYRRIGKHYGKLEQWIFEPHVAEDLFHDYIKRGGVEVLFEHRILTAVKNRSHIEEITLENTYNPQAIGKTIRAKVFIDCSYEGDLMARAGVSYTVGREANTQYQETYNGVQVMRGHQFPDGIDPYVKPGHPGSGVLWGINPRPVLTHGSGDQKVQAYNFRVCLTNDPDNLIPITKPSNYDPQKYELLIRLMEKKPWESLRDGFAWSLMPNSKTDINNRHAFSTDMIGENWEYPDGDYARRAEIWQAHVDYTKGLFYFLGSDPRVPVHIREEIAKWGYPKDEYTDNGNWTHQLYVREARRMIGALVMTQHHCQGREVVEDGIGMAAYTMDSHNCDRQVVHGMVKNEGNVEIGGFGPYPIAYRAITPKQEEADNLLVPVCLSATHIAYGSIRMEPVFMGLAQSAAVAASMAIDGNQPVQQVDVRKLQKDLKQNPLADGSIFEVMVDNEDSEKVKITGLWNTSKRGSYGPTMLLTEDEKGNKDNKAVQFIPRIPEAGEYQIFSYFPIVEEGSARTYFQVFDGKRKREVLISRDDVLVLGQTRGEWVLLGTYSLPEGEKAYVKISNKKADGTVVADAVLFVPVKDQL